MVGQTLVRFIKDGKEVSSYLAIGPIIRPYKGERVDNEVVFELQTVPEDSRYLGVGNATVRVKTPEGEITHKLLLKPEGVWDEWVEEFEDLPKLNDSLLRTLAPLKGKIEDEELKRALGEFLSRLIAHTETFKRELERLEGIAIKEPLWLVQVLKYKPSDRFGLDTLSWVEVSNFDYEREFLVCTEDRRIELSPIKGAELELFDALWRSLEKG
ncbi:MAG: hypothetical protein GXO08_00325, partial [Aquificae bacterium]|nr:hypothetical protein [Aquificota bacterium]